MDSQKWLLLLNAIQQEAVYSWILSFIGSTIMMFRSKDPADKNVLTVIASTLIARFIVTSIVDLLAFFNFELKNMPFSYLVAGLLGDGVVTFFKNLKDKISSKSAADNIFDAILDRLKLKKKDD